ncbi:MAG: manganese efflux pump MntP family protein [Eubacterium sp.]
MNLLTVFVLGIGLSMDAFAVSICKGLSLPKLTISKCLIVGAWFGSFQGLMPLIGYLLGSRFEHYIDTFSAWIAFFLLLLIGANMVREALSEEENDANAEFGGKTMFLLAVATSIDALAIGITFSCIPVAITNALSRNANTFLACFLIACTTFMISVSGVKIGNVFGTRYQKRAEIAGGAILIFLGIKILIEHF